MSSIDGKKIKKNSHEFQEKIVAVGMATNTGCLPENPHTEG
jgi:hypothetical protein